MGSLSADNGISRRTALTGLGASALGLAFMNSPRFAPETKDETLRSRLPKFNEHSRALLSQVLEDPNFSGRIPASAVEALAKSENSQRRRIDVGLAATGTNLFACADFELLRWRRRAWGQRKPLSGSQHRNSRSMPGIRGACRTIGPVERVHELRAIRHLAGSGGRRALRPLPAVHGRNIAYGRNADSDPESCRRPSWRRFCPRPSDRRPWEQRREPCPSGKRISLSTAGLPMLLTPQPWTQHAGPMRRTANRRQASPFARLAGAFFKVATSRMSPSIPVSRRCRPP